MVKVIYKIQKIFLEKTLNIFERRDGKVTSIESTHTTNFLDSPLVNTYM